MYLKFLLFFVFFELTYANVENGADLSSLAFDDLLTLTCSIAKNVVNYMKLKNKNDFTRISLEQFRKDVQEGCVSSYSEFPEFVDTCVSVFESYHLDLILGCLKNKGHMDADYCCCNACQNCNTLPIPQPFAN
uniref:Uncharacterized protein n=1 Tax=Acrobeloides nanus TaxID=290746 RepID=A0A914E2G4_9BILA